MVADAGASVWYGHIISSLNHRTRIKAKVTHQSLYHQLLRLVLFFWPEIRMNSLACWDFFHNFCHLPFFFSKLTISKNSFRNTIRVSNGLDPDQDRHFVGPDLGPNCLQRLSADEKKSFKKTIRVSNSWIQMKPAFCWASSRPKLFAKIISRQHKQKDKGLKCIW